MTTGWGVLPCFLSPEQFSLTVPVPDPHDSPQGYRYLQGPMGILKYKQKVLKKLKNHKITKKIKILIKILNHTNIIKY